MGSPWHRLIYFPLLDRFIYYSLFSCVKISYFHCHFHYWSMIRSNLLRIHRVGLQHRVYFPTQYAINAIPPKSLFAIVPFATIFSLLWRSFATLFSIWVAFLPPFSDGGPFLHVGSLNYCYIFFSPYGSLFSICFFLSLKRAFRSVPPIQKCLRRTCMNMSNASI